MRPALLALTAVLFSGAAFAQSGPAAQYSVEDLAARLAKPAAVEPAPSAAPAVSEAGAAEAAPATGPDGAAAPADGENAQRGFFIVGSGAASGTVRTPQTARTPAATPRRMAPQTSRTVAPTPPRTARAQRAAPARSPAAASVAAGPPMDLMIGFEFGSATLTPQARANADVLAQALRSPAFDTCDRLLIEGHTDRVGGRAFNVALSKRRADAVVEQLVDAGVPRTRLESSGRGFDVPRDPANPSAPTNRRVEGRCIG
jgi:outer membrane protein OmpA-like peptidoglycan-associated protein